MRQKYELVRPYILSVGERRPHKNHVGLIQAYARSQSRASHDLVIVGHAYQGYTEPTDVAGALGLSRQVRFVSGASEEDLRALYSGADVFVLVSLYEGFGLPILEAMACGTPVIVSSTTAAGEVAGPAGIKVGPEDTAEIAAQIDRVLSDSALQSEQTRLGAARHRCFSWGDAARQTIALYRSVAEERS